MRVFNVQKPKWAICGSVTSVCWVVETYVDQGVPQVVCMYRTKDDASETA